MTEISEYWKQFSYTQINKSLVLILDLSQINCIYLKDLLQQLESSLQQSTKIILWGGTLSHWITGVRYTKVAFLSLQMLTLWRIKSQFHSNSFSYYFTLTHTFNFQSVAQFTVLFKKTSTTKKFITIIMQLYFQNSITDTCNTNPNLLKIQQDSTHNPYYMLSLDQFNYILYLNKMITACLVWI